MVTTRLTSRAYRPRLLHKLLGALSRATGSPYPFGAVFFSRLRSKVDKSIFTATELDRLLSASGSERGAIRNEWRPPGGGLISQLPIRIAMWNVTRPSL